LRGIVSKKHRTNAAYSSWRPFPQTLSDVSFTNLTSTVGLQLLNFWLLKVMLRCVNDGVTTIKPGYQATVHASYGQMSHPSHCSLLQEVYLENTHGSLQSGMPRSNNKIRVRFCDGLGRNIMVLCWSHFYPSWPHYSKGVCGQVG
jgi:hypothetical protein